AFGRTSVPASHAWARFGPPALDDVVVRVVVSPVPRYDGRPRRGARTYEADSCSPFRFGSSHHRTEPEHQLRSEHSEERTVFPLCACIWHEYGNLQRHRY